MKRKRSNGRDFTAAFKTREEGEKKYIEGYFAVYESRYSLWGNSFETISRGAFDKSLTEGRNIACLWNHDSNYPLGRQSNGTLRLTTDSTGLYGVVEINLDDSFAADVYARIKRGDVSQCSIGFDVTRESVVSHEDGSTEFRLEEVDLWEVSPCTFPAYTETAIQARRKDKENLIKRCKEAFQERMDKIAKSYKTEQTN